MPPDDLDPRVRALEADSKEMKADVKTLVREVAEIKGRLANMPTTFQLVSWFVGVSIGLTALVFTIARSVK